VCRFVSQKALELYVEESYSRFSRWLTSRFPDRDRGYADIHATARNSAQLHHPHIDRAGDSGTVREDAGGPL